MNKLLPVLTLVTLSTSAVSTAWAQQSARKVAFGQRDPAQTMAPVAQRAPVYAGPRLPARPNAPWTQDASLATARGQHAAVAAGGKIYAWGGYYSASPDGSGSIVEYSSLEIYNPATNTWSAGAAYPFVVRGQAGALGNDGLIYSLSGVSGGLTSAAYRYNPATNTWAAIASVPTAVWLSSAATGNDGRIYQFGGYTGVFIANTQIYNPTTNTWTTGAAMPTARLGTVAVKDAAGLIHIIGGIQDPGTAALATHEVYNPVTNTWTTGAALPVGLNRAGATLGADGNIYVVGGNGSFYNNASDAVSTVYVYSTSTNTWSTGTSLPIRAGENKAVTIGSNIYEVGGANGAILAQTYQMATLASFTWTGATSTDWFTGSNWSGGTVPSSTDDVTIPAGQPRYPVLTAGTASANALTLASGATLTQSGGTLNLAGNFANTGTFTATGGTVNLNGSASQALGGSSRTKFWNLSVGPNAASLAGTADVQRLLTLNGNLNTSSQTFTLLSDASASAMVVNNGGSVVGSTAVQRYIDPSLNEGLGYRHYSSPVQATTVADLATPGFSPVVNPVYNTSSTPGATKPFPTVYGYDEARLTSTNATTQAFEYGYFSPATLGDQLNPGRGYTVNIAASEKVDLVGTLNNGTVPVGALSRGTQTNAGWQLLGNPYPAPLDWNVARTGLPTGVQDAIYVFKSSSQYNGSYQSYVNGVGSLPGGLIPSMQGFFVRVSQNVPAFSFQNSWRLTTYQNPTFNRATADLRPAVQLDLVGAQGAQEPTYVYFEQGATAGFDGHFDAEKLPNTTGLNLSSEAAGTHLAINGLPELTAATTVALNVGVPVTGTYSLTAASLLNLGTTEVYLHDAVTGQLINLKQQPNYSFSASNTALITGRFSLRFNPLRPLATTSATLAAQVQAYPNPAHGQLTIVRPAGGNASATLLDVVGQVVRTVALPTTTTTLDVADVSAGFYLLRVVVNGQTVTKRVVVE